MTQKVIPFAACLIILLLSCKKEQATILKPDNKNKEEVKLSESDSVALKKYDKWKRTTEDMNLLERDTLALAFIEKDTVFLQEFLLKHDSLNVFNLPFEDILKQVYAIDINNDAKKDVIFVGDSGTEQRVTHIYLNNGANFSKVFTEFQFIQNIKFKDKKLVSFTMLNPACCADPQNLEYDYTVSYKGFSPVFKKTRAIGYLENTQSIQRKYASPRNITIVKDNVYTRIDCYIFDADHPFYGDGNRVAKFKKGTQGVTTGSRTEEGKEWLFVLMEPSELNYEYANFHEQPTYTYGWILKSDTDLK